MHDRYVHYPYYGDMTVPQYASEMKYAPHFNNYTLREMHHHFRKKRQMDGNPKRKSNHTHGHLGATTCQDGHVHMHPGVTSKPIETQEGHVINYQKIQLLKMVTFYYEAYTSPPITLPNGYHTHYVEIKTTKNDEHIHIIKGFTQPSKS